MVAMNDLYDLFDVYPQKRELELLHIVHMFVSFFFFPIVSENLANIYMFVFTKPLYD